MQICVTKSNQIHYTWYLETVYCIYFRSIDIVLNPISQHFKTSLIVSLDELSTRMFALAYY